MVATIRHGGTLKTPIFHGSQAKPGFARQAGTPPFAIEFGPCGAAQGGPPRCARDWITQVWLPDLALPALSRFLWPVKARLGSRVGRGTRPGDAPLGLIADGGNRKSRVPPRQAGAPPFAIEFGPRGAAQVLRTSRHRLMPLLGTLSCLSRTSRGSRTCRSPCCSNSK